MHAIRNFFAGAAGFPLELPHVEVLLGLEIPKAQFKAHKSLQIQSQGKWFSHKRCGYNAATARHKGSCNEHYTPAKCEKNIHLYCIYRIKYPNSELAKWFIFLAFLNGNILIFSVFSMQSHLDIPLKQANAHLTPLHAGTRLQFFSTSSVEIILPCRNMKTSITMEKKCVSIACSPSQSNTSFHLLLLQWSCNSFFQNETTSVAENETDIAGRAVQVLRYLSGRKDFRAGGPAPNTYRGQHVYTNTLTK